MRRDLREFLKAVDKYDSSQHAVVERRVRPTQYEVTAILEKLTQEGRFPVVTFSDAEDAYGDPVDIPLVSNVFADRRRCALALGLDPERYKMELSLEYARLAEESLPPETIAGLDAPVKEVVLRGDEVDMGRLPVVRHYEMDISPVFTMACVMKDPDTGCYDVSFIKTFYKNKPRKLGLSIHSPDLERILRKYEERGEPAPVVNVLGHHPAFLLGALALAPFDDDDYAGIGPFMGEPVRLTASETWGDDFLVPADAEIVVEGEIPPGAREVVDPFGEVTRHYQAQCIRQSIDVTALSRRSNAYLQDIFSGHEGHWNLGGVPKEGSVLNAVNAKVGNAKAVHMPHSGVGRLACYLAIDKKKEGDAKLAALTALLESWTFQVVVVVDSDIDVFNEKEVVWALLTMVEPDRDVSYIRNLSTAFTTAQGHNKVIIDATKPLDRAFPERFRVPPEVMDNIDLTEWLSD